MNHYIVQVTLNDGLVYFCDCPEDIDLRLIDNDASFISVPDFVENKQGQVKECRLVRKACTKQQIAKSVCYEYGFYDNGVFDPNWIVLERITKLLKVPKHCDNKSMCWNSHYDRDFRVWLSNSPVMSYEYLVIARTSRICIGRDNIWYSDFDEDTFKRKIHALYPHHFPELDYELDGPEYTKAIKEMTH